jgi:hypothetical protein
MIGRYHKWQADLMEESTCRRGEIYITIDEGTERKFPQNKGTDK